jgi:hypothetical protein
MGLMDYGPMGLMDCGRAELSVHPSLLPHRYVQAFKMFRLEFVYPVSTNAGDKVLIYGRPIPHESVPADAGCCDVLDPMREPLLNCPGSTSLARFSAVTFLFEFAYRLDNLRLCLAFDMTSVRLSVVANSHRHAAMPFTILSLVNGARPIWRAGAFGSFLPCHVRVLSQAALFVSPVASRAA